MATYTKAEKEKRRLYQQAWREKNRAHVREKAREYYANSVGKKKAKAIKKESVSTKKETSAVLPLQNTVQNSVQQSKNKLLLAASQPQSHCSNQSEQNQRIT
jgi:hypothetical protein